MLRRRHSHIMKSNEAAETIALSSIYTNMRGGALDADEDEYDSDSEEEYDSEEADSDSDIDTDDDTDEEEEEKEECDEEDSDESEEEDEYDVEDEDDEPVALLSKSSVSKQLKRQRQGETSSASGSEEVEEYDEPLAPPPMQQFAVSIGVMLISNKIDIMDSRAVKIARFAFLAYLVITQVFLVYVRIRAKASDDRTPITIDNPLSSLVQGGSNALGGASSMVKGLMGSMLSTQMTILEYDLKEAKKMNGALLFPMVFLYFLHFRMKQVQPLLMQTATGLLNLAYSPLFQVYVLGRNLERPFKSPKNPMAENLEGMQGDDEEEGTEKVVDEEGGDDETDDESDDSEEDEYDSDQD